MSDLGSYPPPEGWAPPPPPPQAPVGPTPPSSSGVEIPGWAIGVAVAIVVVMVGALTFVIIHPGTRAHVRVNPPSAASPTPTSASPRHRTSYPAHWDKRVLPEVRLAEAARLLRFKHPVPVRFLSQAAFTKAVVRDDETDAYETKELEHAGGLLKAFGLLDDSVDVVAATRVFSGAAVLAYYSLEDGSITVRGREITASVKATLVHELTHALQDQYFHIGPRETELVHVHTQPAEDALSMLHTLAEGDAQRAEHDYVGTLNPTQLGLLIAAQQREVARAQAGMSSVPQILTALGTPYDIAEGVIDAMAEYGGDAEVAHLFRHPPDSDVVLVDPFRLFQRRAEAPQVTVPALRTGEQELDSGSLGALTWYFVLAARLPATQALRTVDGWAGDAYVEYQDGGRTCVRASFQGRTPGDTATMAGALQQWAQAAPGASRTVTRHGIQVTLESCGSGGDVPAVNDLGPAIGLVDARTSLGLGIMRSGMPPGVARCIAGRYVQTFTPAELTNPAYAQQHTVSPATVAQIKAKCE